MSSYSIAISGLNAQQRAVGVYAQNIANAGVTGKINPAAGERKAYEPLDPVSISVDGGGVRSETVPVNPGTVPVYDPESPDANSDGLIAVPNVSLEDNLVGMQTAKQLYGANAKVIKVQEEMDKALLNIFT